jgi:hypothetical protein
MKQDPDIEKAHELLTRGLSHLESEMKFAQNDYIGNTTSLVKNLNVIEASVILDVPFYKKYQETISPEYILKKYNMKLEI